MMIISRETANNFAAVIEVLSKYIQATPNFL